MYEYLVKKNLKQKVHSFTYYAQSSKEDSFLKNHHEIQKDRFSYIDEKISSLTEKIKLANEGNIEYTPEETTCKFCAYNKMCPKAI
jgi:CRISPR/Cas system-associated exonuclease Cas4 (RecB family)